MNADSNVQVLHSFDNVDVTDLRAGFLAYSVSERQVDQLQGQTAVWIYGAVYVIWEECIQDPDITLEVAEKRLNEQCQWLMSEAAGAMQLTAKQGKLTGGNSLARAWKKIKGGLEAGLSMSEFQTCSAMEREVTRLNKEEKKLARDERVESGINKKALEMAKEEGLEEGTDEHKAKVDELVADMMKKFMTDKSPEASKAEVTITTTASIIDSVDPKYATQAAEIVAYASEHMHIALLELFTDTIPVLTGNYTDEEVIEMAKDQVKQAIDGACKGWLGRAEKHRSKLADLLTKEPEQVSEAG